jgi:hypothetical protein
VLEMTFDAFATKWEFWLGQNDGANDLMAGNLRSQKRFTVRQVIIGKFHELTSSIHLCPFIFHLFRLRRSFSPPLFVGFPEGYKSSTLQSRSVTPAAIAGDVRSVR